MRNDQAPILYYDVTGERRKELVKALGEILLWEPQYQGAPTFSYHVGNYVVDRNGTVMCPDCVTTEIAEKLIENLMERGFTPTSTTLDLYIISLPRDTIDDPALNRLRNLIKSKETILKAALKTHKLQIEVEGDKIYFPWFHITGADGEAMAYAQLISKLAETAKKQKYISEKEKPQDNLKYAMRLFLVRLGFVGNEYKQARKILLRNLSGNCSWKAGHAPERPDTANTEGTEASPEEHDDILDIPKAVHEEFLADIERRCSP